MAKHGFKTVEECMDAGFTWAECVVFTGIDKAGNMRANISKTCPVPMRKALTESLIKGGGTLYKDE